MRDQRIRKMMQAGVVVALAATFTAPTSARAVTDLVADVNVPIAVNANVKADGCKNAPGPKITLAGTVKLGELTADVIFKNNDKGTHKTVVKDVISAVALDFGDGITIPKQPSRTADSLGADCKGTGTGGNPFIWVVLIDRDGVTPISDPVLLGRCVQGLEGNVNLLALLLSRTQGHVGGDGCLNSPGPYITLTGDLFLRGLKAKVILQNNPNPPDPHTAVCAATFDIILEGTPFTICKSPSTQQKACEFQPGAGGNPLISIEFRSDSDSSGEIELGRCNKL